MHEAFDTFVSNIPFYGFAVLCIDHPAVQSLIGRIGDRRLITYGFSPQADVRGENLHLSPEGTHFDVVVTDRFSGDTRVLADLFLPMVGQHNVLNALVVVALGEEMGVGEAVIRDALNSFSGVKRRFTKTGESGGVTVIDDYGHHPVEISAVLQAARQASRGKVVAVVQPHRYTRLLSLFEDFCSCFNDADSVIVADVHSAGEQPIEGADKEHLVDGLRARGHRSVHLLESPEQLPALVQSLTAPGDLVVCLGAGSITTWANELPAKLDALAGSTAEGGH